MASSETDRHQLHHLIALVLRTWDMICLYSNPIKPPLLTSAFRQSNLLIDRSAHTDRLLKDLLTFASQSRLALRTQQSVCQLGSTWVIISIVGEDGSALQDNGSADFRRATAIIFHLSFDNDMSFPGWPNFSNLPDASKQYV